MTHYIDETYTDENIDDELHGDTHTQTHTDK